MQQQPLPLYKTADKTFDEFIIGVNQEAFDAVRQWAAGLGPWFLLLWGEQGVGKSHLLQAALRSQALRNTSMMYLPLQSLFESGADSVQGLEDVSAVGIDNIEIIYADIKWETALFNLFNLLHERGHRLLITTAGNPRRASTALADLKSRLCSGLSYQISDINDEEKKRYLTRRAHQSGMALPDNVANYIITHHSRNLHELSRLFEFLDEAALTASRPLTVPFVRDILAADTMLNGDTR